MWGWRQLEWESCVMLRSSLHGLLIQCTDDDCLRGGQLNINVCSSSVFISYVLSDLVPVMELLKVLSTQLKPQTGGSEIPSLFLFSTRDAEKREKTGQQRKNLTNKTKTNFFHYSEQRQNWCILPHEICPSSCHVVIYAQNDGTKVSHS